MRSLASAKPQAVICPLCIWEDGLESRSERREVSSLPLSDARDMATLLAGWVALHLQRLTVTLGCTETRIVQNEPRCLAGLTHDMGFVLVDIYLILPEQSIPATLL